MNPETNKNRSENLTRRQKLLRRFLPLALVAGAGAGIVHHEATASEPTPNSVSSSINPSSEATVISTATATFESGGGWGHDTATEAITEAVTDATTAALDEIDADNKQTVSEIVEELPKYDQATEALEMAEYGTVQPDAGDTMNVTVRVTADDSEKVSYEVIDAQIDDSASSTEK